MKRGRPKGRSRDNRSFGPLGDLIRTARLGKGLGLADVAKACKCSVQFVSNIEHGRAPLPWDKCEVLAKYLNVSVDDVQAANLAIRSDFKSLMVTGKSKKGVVSPALLSGAKSAATAFAATVKDKQLQEVIEAYQAANTAKRKDFYKTAMRLLG